ncbi:hypothetical protein ACFQ4O_09445 [Methylopila musalis]|uniref:Calcium-binding protein n=1 Tax=Methylopila musalis TaxID=1134781 RepID=A0ABW3Z7I6_9HYPH
MADYRGTNGADTLTGGAGHDEIDGLGGADKLFGGAGNDELDGGSGDDVLDGGVGNDELEGGSGRDLFVYGAGRDEIDDFSLSDDRIQLADGLGVTSFSQLIAKGRSVDGGEDTLFDFGGGNTLLLEDVSLGSLKASHFVGLTGGSTPTEPSRDGDDTLTGTNQADYIDGRGGNDVIRGGRGDDELLGGYGDDQLHGDRGNDEIKGGPGNDILSGGLGNDDLEGGSGHDRLNGGAGRNELHGGRGRDTFVFHEGVTEVEDFQAGFDRLEIDASLGVSTFSQFIARATVTDGGEDLTFRFGAHELTLENVAIADLSASDVLFV